jgi:hypothetical protein
MTLKEFQDSLQAEVPPSGLGPALAGLWWDAKGDWQQAHESAQRDEGPAGSWVHGYLHRKEAEIFNAEYWYKRAGKSTGQGSLEKEWLAIVESLLQEASVTSR